MTNMTLTVCHAYDLYLYIKGQGHGKLYIVIFRQHILVL